MNEHAALNISDSWLLVQAKCSILDGADNVRSEGKLRRNPISFCLYSEAFHTEAARPFTRRTVQSKMQY